MGFRLVGAELEGRALYEVSIGARQIFIDWTHAEAYEGSTKPNRAGEEFDRLANDFDLDRGKVGTLEGLYSRARSAGWDGKVGDAGGQGSADASGQYDEAPDPEPEEAANGAESTDEPDGEDNGQGEARQTSDPSPLDQFTRPCRRNVNDASNFARLIKYFSGDLVIALPDPSDSKPAVGRGRSKALPDIYAIASRGMLSSARAGSLLLKTGLLKTGRLYYAECYGLEGAERHACADDARKLGNDGVLERLCGVAEAAVHDLRDAGALPRGLVVKCKSEIDCHLNYIGTPKDVLDLRTGHIVPPAEGPPRIHRIPRVLCGPHGTQRSDLGQNGPWNNGGQCTGGGAGHSTGSLPRNRRQTRLRNRDLPGIPRIPLDRLGQKETRMARPHSQYPRGSRPRPPRAPSQAALKNGAQTRRADPEFSPFKQG